ncbi:MAG TPA: amidohydrolase family protein [Candidatus Acidoferrales bacterium]|nr:amidohydrolase family protein [Candidatus Acidoferrales bacterium]
MECDLILRHATVVDGSGAEPVTGDVAVDGGSIRAVGSLGDLKGANEVDCTGKVVAPGFIDMHSHSDWVAPLPEHGDVLAPLVEQGITTMIGGNCGCSPAPYLPSNKKLLPLVGRMLHDHELDYGWSSMGSFLDALEQRGVVLNIAQLVGHGTVRVAAMGSSQAAANAEQIAAMADLLRAGLDEGAIGFSTGLGYAPGVYADTNELVGITAPLKERGGIYTSHARSYIALGRFDDANQVPSNLHALDETAAIGRAHGVKVQHSHLIFVGDKTWPTTDRALEHLDRLASEIDIGCDAFPYVGGNTTLVVFMPPWTLNNLKDATSDPEQRERVAGTLTWVLPALGMRWADTQILWVPDESKAHYQGLTVAEIAADRGKGETETYLDLVHELGSQTRIMNWNYSGRDGEEASLRKVLQHPLTCFEADTILTGNGFDNPASYGNFPRVLGRYVRDLKLITLPDAIRRMTGASAARFGIKDRGLIAPGLAADLVVFDPLTVGDNTTRSQPNRSPSGIETVLLNGEIVVRKGKFARSSRAGKVLRRA